MRLMKRSSQRVQQGIAAGVVALLVSAPVHALGLDCDNVDAAIEKAHAAANEEFARANALQAAVNAAPSLWDSITDSLSIWNPFSTSVGDAVQGAAQDKLLSACGTIAKRAAVGIDVTNKLIQQADVIIASQGAGVAEANARFARIRGHKWMKEVNRLLKWKQEHCQCTEDERGNAEVVGDDGTKGNLLEWLERGAHAGRGGHPVRGDDRSDAARPEQRRP